MPTKITDKMKAYRERLRQAGLRPIQVWVPDTRASDFQEKLQRQVASISHDDEQDTLDFIESAADLSE